MIKISDATRGEIIVKPIAELKDNQKFTIKSLQGLILACMGSEDDPKLPNLIEILTEAINKASKLYNDTEDEILEYDPTELFREA